MGYVPPPPPGPGAVVWMLRDMRRTSLLHGTLFGALVLSVILVVIALL